MSTGARCSHSSEVFVVAIAAGEVERVEQREACLRGGSKGVRDDGEFERVGGVERETMRVVASPPMVARVVVGSGSEVIERGCRRAAVAIAFRSWPSLRSLICT